MNSFLSIIVNDIKNTRRDPTLLLLFWVPVLILCVVRFGLPILTSYLPIASNYYEQFIVLFALLNAVFPGFILAFIILDEKDNQLISVIKVTPVSLSGFLIARIFFMVLFGALGSLVLLLFNGLYSFTYLKIAGICILSALNIPIFILLISTLAKNKVEGLPLLKVANIFLLIPVLILFIESPYENMLGIFPSFWVFKFIDTTASLPVLFLGITVLLSINYQIFRFALKRLN